MSAKHGSTRPRTSKAASSSPWAKSRRAHQELDEDDNILVLCHHGARSLSVAAWLRQQGFDKAQSVAGGIDAWSRSIDPHVPRY